MAIAILTDPFLLNPTPTHGQPSFDISLRQRLEAFGADERAMITYSLDQSNDIFFQLQSGPPVKHFTVEHMVIVGDPQRFTDDVMLVRGVGEEQLQVNISELLRDESGNVLHSSCLVNIDT